MDRSSVDDVVRRGRPPILGGRIGATVIERAIGGGWSDDGWGGVGITQQLLNLSGAEQLSSAYAENQWVRACLKILGNGQLQAPPRLYEGDPLEEEDARQLPTDHPIMALLRSPNEHQSGSTFRFANLVHYKLDGETIWFLMTADGKPVSTDSGARAKIQLPAVIVPVRGDLVEIKRSNGAVNGTYLYPSTERVEFPASSVVHFRDYDPDNPLRGSGDVESLLRDLAIEFAAQRYQEGLLANGGQPGGWIISKKTLGPDRRKAEEAKLRDVTSSNANAGAWHIVEGAEVEVKPNTFRPRDMEYADLRLWNFREIARVLGVPLPLLGDLEHSSYDNMGHARRQLWTGGNGIISYLRAEEDTINSFFLPRLAGIGGRRRIVLRHDLSLVADLQEDVTDRFKAAAEIADRGVGWSVNAAARAIGLSDSDLPPEGETILIPAGKVELAKLLSGELAPDPDEPDPEPDPEDEDDEPDPDDADDEEELALSPRTTRALEILDRAERIAAPHEAAMAAKMRGYLRSYELAQVRRVVGFAERGVTALSYRGRVTRALPTGSVWLPSLTEADIVDLLLDPEEWLGKLHDSAAPIIKVSFADAAEALAEQFGTTALTAEEPAVIALLERQTIKLARDVNGTLGRKVRRAILDVFAEKGDGVGITELQEAIKRLLPELRGSLKQAFTDRDSRALAIARTEVGRATSTAAFEQAKKDGAVASRWVTSGDEQVRDAHVVLDGEQRILGDEYAPGLKFPRDPDAPAAQVVNCRCDTEFVFDELPRP